MTRNIGCCFGEIAPGAENGDSSAGLRGVFLRGDSRDHGVERIASESVHLSGESIYESIHL